MSNFQGPPPLDPSQPATLGYAIPGTYQVQAGGIFVNDKRQIVGPPQMALPHRCVVCNAPGAVRLRKTYSWHHPAIFLVILLNLLIYVIVALIVRKRGTCEFSLCATHAKRRRVKIWIGWLGVPACIVLAIVFGEMVGNRSLNRDFGPVLVALAILGAIVSLLFALMQLPVFQPKYIDAREMRLAKAGPEFLHALASENAIPVAMQA